MSRLAETEARVNCILQAGISLSEEFLTYSLKVGVQLIIVTSSAAMVRLDSSDVALPDAP